MKDVIMAISIDKRSSAAPTVQEILTKYGEMIHFRLGLHDLHHSEKNENGRILLQPIHSMYKLMEKLCSLRPLPLAI